MKRLALAVVLFATPAQSQQIDVRVGPGGVQVTTGDGTAVTTTPAGTAVITGDGSAVTATHAGTAVTTVGPPRAAAGTVSESGPGYHLTWEPARDRTTVMRVLSPEGARCQVWDGKKRVAEDDVPMSFPAKAARFYRFVITTRDGQVWEKKFEARRRHTGTLRVVAPPPVAAQQPPAPLPSGPAPMSEPDFAALARAIEREDFGGDKLRVLQTAAPQAFLTIGQVGRLVELFDFGSEKVKVVEICANRILDRQNAFQLYSHFDFDSEKEQVRRIFAP